jgi:spermidine/putrescine transport system permease protein
VSRRNDSDLMKKGVGIKIFGALVFFFLYFPLIIVIIYSFTTSRTLTGENSATIKWFAQLLQDEALIEAFFHSLIVGFISVFCALILGTAGAFFLTKVNFPGKGVFRAMVLLPYILPPIIIGLTLLIFIRMLNIKLSMFTIILGHIAFTTPIVVLQVSGRLERMGPNYQFAAQDLGANPVQTFFYVTLPMIKTALIGAGLLAFTVSFDEIIISYFLTGTWMTLPVYIYGMMRFGLSSKIFAISSVVLVMSLFIVVIMSKYIGRAGDEVRVKKRKQAK